MNDVMKRAVDGFLNELVEKANVGTLFEGTAATSFLPDRFQSNFERLKELIFQECIILSKTSNLLKNHEGIVLTRPQIRARLIARQFARFTSSDYNEAIKMLLRDGKLVSETERMAISDSVRIKVIN